MRRRHRYRVSVDTQDPIQVSLSHRGRPAVACRLLDANAGGVGVAVPEDAAPRLEPGATVDLTFWLLRSHRAVVVGARVVGGEPAAGGRRLGLAFLEPERIDAELARELGVVFNRRASVRMRPAAPVAVRIGPAGEPDAPALEGRLVDLGPDGLALELRDAEGPPCSARLPQRLVVALPDDPAEPLELVGRIRHRSYRAGIVRCGVAFDPAATPDLGVARLRIAAWMRALARDAGGAAAA